MTSWVVYLLECEDGSIYTGITNNLEKRINDHNCGKGAKYTRSRLPVKLLKYFVVEGKSEALKIEIKIKKLKRSDKIKLIDLKDLR